MMGEAVVAITGASGARYGVRLLEALSEAGWKTHLIVTREGALNLELECDQVLYSVGAVVFWIHYELMHVLCESMIHCRAYKAMSYNT